MGRVSYKRNVLSRYPNAKCMTGRRIHRVFLGDGAISSTAVGVGLSPHEAWKEAWLWVLAQPNKSMQATEDRA